MNTSAGIARNFELHQRDFTARRADPTSIRMSRIFTIRKRRLQARETSTRAAFASLRELSERATLSSPCPNEITVIIVCEEKESEERAVSRESTKGRTLHIHGNCRGWIARCVSGVVYN